MTQSSKEIDEGVIDLRANGVELEETEFRIDHDDSEEADEALNEAPRLSSTPVSTLEDAAMQATDRVKIKFDKFVNLIATHDIDEVFDKNRDEDVIIGTDLLADLANAHEDKKDNKISLIFVGGIFLGIVVTWMLLSN